MNGLDYQPLTLRMSLLDSNWPVYRRKNQAKPSKGDVRVELKPERNHCDLFIVSETENGKENEKRIIADACCVYLLCCAVP
jgi:hypothetical protein